MLKYIKKKYITKKISKTKKSPNFGDHGSFDSLPLPKEILPWEMNCSWNWVRLASLKHKYMPMYFQFKAKYTHNIIALTF